MSAVRTVVRGLDAAAWPIAMVVAAASVSLPGGRGTWAAVVITGVALGCLQLLASGAAALYRARHPRTMLHGVGATMASFVVCGLVGTVVHAFAAPMSHMPTVLVPMATIAAALLAAAGRYVIGQVHAAQLRPRGAQRAIVYGAGSLGAISVHQMNHDKASPYVAVAVVDDDLSAARREVEGVPVLGTIDDLARLASSTGATALVVAIARADAALLQRATDAGRRAGLAVKVFPTLGEVLTGRTHLTDLRAVDVSDIIGRRPVDTGVDRVADSIAGRRVLVTGAGGSIGAELCAQIHRLGPAELFMLDRDETALQSVQIDLLGNGLLTERSTVLADIRDRDGIRRLFEDLRPDVVIHAAALKHLPLLERYPDEAWKTNVLGTRNVLDAAEAAGVPTFVNISTDKAADPTSVLGRSKRLAEALTAERAESTGNRYLSVRFGNVLGSRGSMVPLFARLIAEGKPLTVTDADATRYFMTIPEACQLVIQAGAIGVGGEVLVLDMGEPVRILDIARRMIQMSGKDIDIVFTGLRDGEKLHEQLLGLGERDERPLHPLISHTTVPPLDPEALSAVRQEWLPGVPRGVAS